MSHFGVVLLMAGSLLACGGLSLADQTSGAATLENGQTSRVSGLAARTRSGDSVVALRTLAILFNFKDDSRTPFGIEDVRAMLFTGTYSTRAFFMETSYGRVRMTGRSGNPDGDVVGWLTISAPRAKCDVPTWQRRALGAAQTQLGISPGDYDRIFYVFPRQSVCSFGGSAINTRDLAINGINRSTNPDRRQSGIYSHELGHTFGMAHASLAVCQENGSPVAFTPRQGVCHGDTYGNAFDVMGGSAYSRQFGVLGRRLLSQGTPGDSVLRAAQVRRITRSGTYRIYATNRKTPQGAPSDASQGLRIYPSDPKSQGSPDKHLVIECRKPSGIFDDFEPNSPVVNGVLVIFSGIKLVSPSGNLKSWDALLDLTPETSGPEAQDQALTHGREVTLPLDWKAGGERITERVRLKTLDARPETSYCDVQIKLEGR